MTGVNLANQLSKAISENIDFLNTLENPSTRPKPDKWSPKELIGHLIDSANNNHRRFVKAQFQDNLIFTGYKQNEWVDAQQYNKADWYQILEMWATYNKWICNVIESIPDEKLNKRTTDNNYFKIGWRSVEEGEASSLAFLIEDYILHIQHHIRQIRELSF